jgi:hypothetical protein
MYAFALSRTNQLGNASAFGCKHESGVRYRCSLRTFFEFHGDRQPVENA